MTKRISLNKNNLALILQAKDWSMKDLSKKKLDISHSYLRTLKTGDRKPQKGTKGYSAIQKINQIARGIRQNKYIFIGIIYEKDLGYYFGVVRERLTKKGIQNVVEKFKETDKFSVIEFETYFNHKNFVRQFTENTLKEWKKKAIKLGDDFRNLPEFISKMRGVLTWK